MTVNCALCLTEWILHLQSKKRGRTSYEKALPEFLL